MVPVTARGQIGHFVHERFKQFGIQHGLIVKRNNRSSLEFQDFDGTRLVLVADNGEEGVRAGVPWVGSDVPVGKCHYRFGPCYLDRSRSRQNSPCVNGILEPRRADIEAKLRPLELEGK